MGCSEARVKDYPILIMNYEADNKEQKNYCLKFKDNYCNIYNKNYEIKSYTDTTFSIKLKIKDIIYDIQTEFNDSEEVMDQSLEHISNLLNNSNNKNINEKEENILLSIEEKEKFKAMKLKILENQKKLRKNYYIFEEQDKTGKNDKINLTLEDMCIYGNITKKEIKEEKKKNPEKFIDISEALKLEKEDPGLFALGLISQNLESLGIETAIDITNNDDTEEGLTSLQFISNGMLGIKKYDLHFDFGEERNEELLNNKEEFENFKKNLKLKLSKDYNIPVNQIIVTFPHKENFQVQVIFQSDEFNNLDINEFIKKFKNDLEFKEFSNLKDINIGIIMEGCKLKKKDLDPRGHRDNWVIIERRGGHPYDPPLGWIGIGLKVRNKYDNGDNTWIEMNNCPGEWCVAYHGVEVGQSSNEIQYIIGKINKMSFKKGNRQVHANCPDIYHPGKKVGTGIYCSPIFKTASNFAGITCINGVRYKTLLQVRVNPVAIRHCNKCFYSRDPFNYWVVNGTPDEIRPFRILYKKC